MIKFLASNWLWIVLIVGFVAMHRSGMGCGMGHGGHAGHGSDRDQTGGDQTGEGHSSHGMGCGMGHGTTRRHQTAERDPAKRDPVPDEGTRGVR